MHFYAVFTLKFVSHLTKGKKSLNFVTLKKIKLQSISDRVFFLYREARQHFILMWDKFMMKDPIKRKDFFEPRAVNEFRIGHNRVEHTVTYKHPKRNAELRTRPINKAMTYVISPFRKIKDNMNIFIILFAIAVLFAGCGSDNPVNNGNPPPTTTDSLVYSLDSVSLYGSGLQTFSFTDSCGSLLAGDSIKITFSISSNCITSDSALAGFYLGHPFNAPFYGYTTDLNNSFTVTRKVLQNFLTILYVLEFKYGTNRFIKLYNVKLFKCHS